MARNASEGLARRGDLGGGPRLPAPRLVRVRSVVDPFAEEGVGKGPATVSREEFLGALSGERGRRAKEPVREFAPRIPAGKEGDFW